jgi:ribosomal protein L2
MKIIFEKGYLPKCSGEVFKVMEHDHRPKRLYKLQDMAGEDIAGTFYKEDVQPISYDPGKQVPVEKILKTKTILGKKEYLVKWLHLPNKFNSWVKDKDLKRI